VAEVRACALGEEAAPPPAQGERPHPTAPPVAPRLQAPGPPADRGPSELGRTLVVPQGADLPAGWDGVDELLLDEITALEPGSILDELQARWSRREPYVVRLDTNLSSPPATVIRRDPALLSPDLQLPRERLYHLVWSNALLTGPNGTTLPIAAAAVSAGATAAGGSADLVLPDGDPVLVDGGPLDLGLAASLEYLLLHSISIAAGSLTPLGTSDLDAALAPDQLAAVHHRGGPARIVAPAGSGKTRVLTERARYLLSARNLPTRALTLVAFNKRAQLEMEERTADLPGLRVRTLNALALAIVNGTDGFRRPAESTARVQTIDEPEVRRLLRRLVEVPRRTNTDPLATWIEALSAARLGLRDPAAVIDEIGPDVSDLEQVLEQYRLLLQRQNLVDFDEQILRGIEVLLADPQARSHAQDTCQLLLVDEFQDLTPAHMLLIRLLAGPRADVFGVGDDDQTIYGFTGATPEWLIDYDRWFPDATPLALEVNYRCPPAVVDGAKHLLAQNNERVEKNIRSAPGRDHHTTALQVVTTPDPLTLVVERVSELLTNGAHPTDIVILGRVNVALAAPQIALGEAGLPVTHAVTPDLLQRTGVRALLAWLRLACDPGSVDPADVSEAVRRPSRGLSQRVREWMGEHRSVHELRRLGKRLGGRDQHRIDDFLDDIEVLADIKDSGATAGELIAAIGDEIGVANALGSLDGARRSVDRSTHLDDLDALVQLGGVHTDPTTFTAWLQEVLGRPGASREEGITLSTVHRVKGLEWPHVVIVGANSGTFPHRLAELEEERRVFHVALTRSSQSTTIISDLARPSTFAAEVEGRAPVREPSPPRRSTPSAPPSDGLLDQLKSWRLESARDASVPAYVIFTDATLEEIVTRRPSTQRELARVKGIGPKKLDLYAEEILDMVASVGTS